MQSGLSGEALVHQNKSLTLQDGKPRLILGAGGGGRGGPFDFELLFPDTIPYSDGKLLTWVSDGVYITLLSNLSEEEVLRMAGEAVIAGKTYVFINPNSLGTQGQIFAAGFELWGPTYIPSGLDDIFPSDLEGVPDILYTAYSDSAQFVRLTQRAVPANESLPEGESITIGGQPAVLGLVSDTILIPPYGPYQRTVEYTNAVQITWVVDGTWIQILTNTSREEAIRVVESMVREE